MVTHTTEDISDRNIILPPLEYGPNKHSIGHIHHVIDIGGTYLITGNEEIQISSRIKENLLHLSNGLKVIITNRKKLLHPDSVDGILNINDKGQLKWLSHKRLEQFKQDISKQMG